MQCLESFLLRIPKIFALFWYLGAVARERQRFYCRLLPRSRDIIGLFWDVFQLTLHQSIDFKVLLTLLRQLEASCKLFL